MRPATTFALSGASAGNASKSHRVAEVLLSDVHHSPAPESEDELDPPLDSTPSRRRGDGGRQRRRGAHTGGTSASPEAPVPVPFECEPSLPP
ncbi:hypothetical protein GGX14DRAFT_558815 [Mycena pura]|uniref:Uncharacterized protein n=1 Tax=Mycena pura TaxID=153505 RepID=A0AAD6VV39_9AGAR|nr:hypothetical protein GGX14DRAFT_558815 [Mycena pura]